MTIAVELTGGVGTGLSVLTAVGACGWTGGIVGLGVIAGGGVSAKGCWPRIKDARDSNCCCVV